MIEFTLVVIAIVLVMIWLRLGILIRLASIGATERAQPLPDYNDDTLKDIQERLKERGWLTKREKRDELVKAGIDPNSLGA